VLTLIGPDGSQKELTLDDFKALFQTTGQGGLKTKRGTIKDIGTYKGVALKDILQRFGLLSRNYRYIITAADGYQLPVDYDFVLGKNVPIYDENGNPTNGAVIPILAYEYNRKPIEFILGGKNYQLQLALVNPKKTYITPGNRWVKAVVKIEVIKTTTPTQTPGETTGYVEIKDFRNETLRVKQPVDRIVSLYGLATQMVYFLSVEDGKKILGGTPLAINDRFVQLLDPEVKSRMIFVGSPKSANVETIKKLNPDVILTAWWGDPNLNAQLEGLGMPVVALNLETVDDYLKSLETVGKILNREKKAEEAVSYYRDAVAFVTGRISKASERPKVLLLYYSMKDKAFKAPGRAFFQNELIELAGGKSVSKSLPGGWNVINVEQVVEWNPDVIITVSYSFTYPSTGVKKTIMNDPAWSSIKAVKEGKVYAMPNDGESWDYPAPKWVLGLYWLAKILHPDLFQDVYIQKIADEFYERWYGIDPGKVTIVGDLQ